MNDELLLARLRETRTENLMILLVDAAAGRNRITDWYDTPPGTLARRSLFDDAFIRRSGNLDRIRQIYRSKVQTLCRERRWRALFWLHREFPDRHLADAPPTAIEPVRRVIEDEARAIRIGNETGWDQILSIPIDDAARHELAVGAASAIGADIRASFGESEAWHVFPSEMGEHFGMRATREPHDWASGIVLYVETINRLRTGNRAYQPGTMPGAGFRLRSHSVERARAFWDDGLSEGQREVLANDTYWAIVLSRIWADVTNRIDFGLDYGRIGRTTADLEEGRYRYPPQSLR